MLVLDCLPSFPSFGRRFTSWEGCCWPKVVCGGRSGQRGGCRRRWSTRRTLGSSTLRRSSSGTVGATSLLPPPTDPMRRSADGGSSTFVGPSRDGHSNDGIAFAGGGANWAVGPARSQRAVARGGHALRLAKAQPAIVRLRTSPPLEKEVCHYAAVTSTADYRVRAVDDNTCLTGRLVQAIAGDASRLWRHRAAPFLPKGGMTTTFFRA